MVLVPFRTLNFSSVFPFAFYHVQTFYLRAGLSKALLMSCSYLVIFLSVCAIHIHAAEPSHILCPLPADTHVDCPSYTVLSTRVVLSSYLVIAWHYTFICVFDVCHLSYTLTPKVGLRKQMMSVWVMSVLTVPTTVFDTQKRLIKCVRWQRGLTCSLLLKLCRGYSASVFSLEQYGPVVKLFIISFCDTGGPVFP